MEKLIHGVARFQAEVFPARRDLFERLGTGQQPEVLFITCSDSRIDPNLLTQTDPGDLFVVRNAGNMVPPHGAADGGETATIEFGVAALGVKHIVVCGHSHCGAMKGLLHPEALTELPTVARWLGHAEATRRVVKETCGHLEGEPLLDAAIERNVVMQLENLRTLPAVAARIARGELTLHGWVYRIETGEVLAYDSTVGRFAPLGQPALSYDLPPAPAAAGRAG